MFYGIAMEVIIGKEVIDKRPIPGLGWCFLLQVTPGIQGFYFALGTPGKTAQVAEKAKASLVELKGVSTFEDAISLAIDEFSKLPKDWSIDFHDPETIEGDKRNFEIIDEYCSPWSPCSILDIGSGYARVSEYLQKKYDCDLYLLDGDAAKIDENKIRDIGYGEVSNFKFYSSKLQLISSYDARKMRYSFIDASLPQYPDMTFDLIFSLTSCGFHYPLRAYSKVIRRHSSDKSKVIIQLRRGSERLQIKEAGFSGAKMINKERNLFEVFVR